MSWEPITDEQRDDLARRRTASRARISYRHRKVGRAGLAEARFALADSRQVRQVESTAESA